MSGVLLSSHASLPDVAVRELLHARIHGMPVLELADYYEQYWSRVPVTHLQGEWFALSRGFDLLHSPIQTQLKRASDLLLAGGLLICASPIMLVVALAVKLDSRGPILFKQTRVGRFVILKEELKEVEPAWLIKQNYVSGDIWGYVESSGCCSTDMKVKSRIYLFEPGKNTPTFEVFVPIESYVDHDRSTVAAAKARMGNKLAQELADAIIKKLTP